MSTRSTEWYIAIDGKARGPLTSDQLIAAIEQGVIQPDTLMWRDGFPEWMPAKAMPKMASQAPQAPPQTAAIVDAPPDVSESLAPRGAKGASQDIAGRSSTVDKKGATVNPIAVHWRGEYDLIFSYWVIGCLLTIPLVLLVGLFGNAIDKLDASPATIGALVFVMVATVSVVSIWQIVGIWRSAGRAIIESWRTFWPNVARVVMMLTAIRVSYEFTTISWPMMSESIRLAMRGDGIDPAKLTLTESGQGLIISGGLSYGTAKRVKAIGEAAPKLSYLQLESPGGLVSEGLEIYEYIRNLGFATVTSGACESACAIAFLGGSKRYRRPSAKLGFHSISYGSLDSNALPHLNDKVRKVFEVNQLPVWFIEKAVATASSGMWYPTLQELRDARVIDDVLTGDGAGGESGDQLKKLNEGLPNKIDAITTLVRISFTEDFLVYDYTIAAHAQDVDPLSNRQTIVRRVCSNSEMRDAMRNGTKYAYRYTREGGGQIGNLGTVQVLAQSCESAVAH